MNVRCLSLNAYEMNQGELAQRAEVFHTCSRIASARDTSFYTNPAQRAKHRATPKVAIRLIYAGSANMSNDQKPIASDYESEGRRFESCRARQKKPRKSRGVAIEVYPFFLAMVAVWLRPRN